MDAISHYKKMIDSFYEGVYFVDLERRITFWNQGAERITGFLAHEVLGKSCYDNILNHVDDSGTQLCLGGCPLEKTIDDGETREAEVYLHHKEGHRVKIFVRTTPLYEDESMIGAVEVFTDDSKRASLISELEELKLVAMYDQLTQLPNRRYMDSYLKTRMEEYHSLGISFGLAFLDIDHFKRFNDTYGHQLGDRVLQMVSKTYQSSLRDRDLVGRWGGEEFLAIFSAIDKRSLQRVAERIRTLVEHSVLREEGEELSVTISVGATMVLSDDTLDTLVERADRMMYESKENGRNQVTIG